jgi:hypothetical protein
MTRPDGTGLSPMASDGWVAPGLAQPDQGSANRIHPNVMPAVHPAGRHDRPQDHTGLPARRADAGLQILGGSEMRQN